MVYLLYERAAIEHGRAWNTSGGYGNDEMMAYLRWKSKQARALPSAPFFDSMMYARPCV